jgi:hypothetical protein
MAGEKLVKKALQAIGSEAAKKRAAELGYDTSKTWYHSSLEPLEKFKPTGEFMGRSGVSGIHLTDNPEMANRYLERYGEFNYKQEPFQKNVMPVYVKTQNVLERNEPFPTKLHLGSPLPADYKNPLPDMGYDALLRDEAINARGGVKHVDPSARGAITGKELILTDPSQVRSIYDEYAHGGMIREHHADGGEASMDRDLIERALRLARGGYADGGDIEFQSNGMPVFSDGQVNWGESAADFARADAAMRAMQGSQSAPEAAPRPAPMPYAAPRNVPTPPPRPASLDMPQLAPAAPVAGGSGSYAPTTDFDAPAQATPEMLFDPDLMSKDIMAPKLSMGFNAPPSSFGGPSPNAPSFTDAQNITPGAPEWPPAPSRPAEGKFTNRVAPLTPPAAPEPTTEELLSLLSGGSPVATDAPLPPPRPASLNASMTLPVSNLTPAQRDLIVRTIAAESSGKTPEESRAIAHVIMNRISSGKYGATPEKVLFARNQFEPWSDPRGSNYPMRHRPGTTKYEKAMQALDAAMGNDDITGGATHFWGPKAQRALGRNPPAFARTPGFDIGDTRFHREEGGPVEEREGHAGGSRIVAEALEALRGGRKIFPKPQRMFPEGARPPGGEFIDAATGEAVTGQKPARAVIGVTPEGKPIFLADTQQVDVTGSPGPGSTKTMTNLYRKSAGWDWQNAPEGYENIPMIVSTKNRGQHYYSLGADYPKGVDLARYPKETSEPRLKPTTQGNVYPGDEVGTILNKKTGDTHPVYDMVTIRNLLAGTGSAGAGAAAMPEDREGHAGGKRVVDKAMQAVSSMFESPGMTKWREGSVIPSAKVEDRYFTGTSKDKDFPDFKVDRHGAWFTKDPAEASTYAVENDSRNLKYNPDTRRYEEVNSASRVIPAFLKAENPYTGPRPQEIHAAENYKKAQSDWFDTLRAQGHDAWMPDELGGSLAVILRDPTQIKSAISNTGDFGLDAKRIDREYGGPVEREHHADGEEVGTQRQRTRDTLDQLGRFEDKPPMDPEVMGQNWANAVQRFRDNPIRPGEAAMSARTPSARERLYDTIIGSPENGTIQNNRANVAGLLAGSQGTGIGVLDFVPGIGSALNATDMGHDIGEGNYVGAGLSGAMMAAAPFAGRLAKPAMDYGRRAIDLAKSVGPKIDDTLDRYLPQALGAAGAGAMLAPQDAEAAKAPKILQQAIGKTFKHPISGTKLVTPIEDMSPVFGSPKEAITPRRPMNWAETEGGVFMPATWDRTRGDRAILESINGQKLTNPDVMEGGPLYMNWGDLQPDKQVAASGEKIIERMMSRAADAKKLAGEGDVYLANVLMGLEGGDFSHMVANPLIDLARQRGFSKAEAALVDDAIRKAIIQNQPTGKSMEKKVEYANRWPGIMHKDLDKMVWEMPGAFRSSIAKAFDTKAMKDLGVPDVGSVRFAATQPELLNSPSLSTGFSVAKVNTDGAPVRSGHTTYSSGMPGLGYSGGSQVDIPFDLFWRDFMKTRPPVESGSNRQRAFTTQMPLQQADAAWVDAISDYERNVLRGVIPPR